MILKINRSSGSIIHEIPALRLQNPGFASCKVPTFTGYASWFTISWGNCSFLPRRLSFQQRLETGTGRLSYVPWSDSSQRSSFVKPVGALRTLRDTHLLLQLIQSELPYTLRLLNHHPMVRNEPPEDSSVDSTGGSLLRP